MKLSRTVLISALLLVVLIVPALASTTGYYYTTAGSDGYLKSQGTHSYTYHRTNTYGTVDSGSLSMNVELEDAAASPDIYQLSRIAQGFDTRTLPTGLIQSAKIRLYGYAVGTGAGSETVTIVAFAPATNGSITGNDFNKFGTVFLSNNLTTGAFNANGFNNFTLNANGLNAIRPGSWSNFGVIDVNDLDGNTAAALAGFSSWGYSYMDFRTREYGVGFYNVLEITFIATPITAFHADKIIGGTPLSIQFTDDSQYDPTNWSWSYRLNGTSGWTQFNTTKNPAHSFTTGVYDINLTSWNTAGSNTTIKTSYIASEIGWPTASFTQNVTGGYTPLAVQFTDTSDVTSATGYLWNFGDGTTSTAQSPVHSFVYGGAFTVSMNVTNGTHQFSKSTQINLMHVNITHPIAYNIKQSPGYLYPTQEPWKTAITGLNGINSTADTGLTVDYRTANGNRAYYSKMMALRYLTGGGDQYKTMTIAALMNSSTSINCAYAGDGPGYFGDFAVAYDLIQPNLTSGQDATIRDNLAVVADTCYKTQTNLGVGYIDMAQQTGGDYPQIATFGTILSDYTKTNATITTTPAQWEALGTTGSWVSDPLHSYYYTRNNTGAMGDGWNRLSGFNHAGSYIGYYYFAIVDYWNVWSNAHGRSILDEYPAAKQAALNEAKFQVLPQNVMPSFEPDGNVIRDFGKYTYNILDPVNRSIQKRAMDLQQANWNNGVLVYPEATANNDNAFMTYVSYYNYTAMPDSVAIAPPVYTSQFGKNYGYNVFRSDWTPYSDWLGFVIWEDIVTANREMLNPDQFSVQYASHGDLLIQDGGENKYDLDGWGIYGSIALAHNGLLFGGFTRMALQLGNLTYSGIPKINQINDGVHLQTYYQANTTNVINSSRMQYIDSGINSYYIGDSGTGVNAGARGNTFSYVEPPSNGGYTPATSAPIAVSRVILRPFNDYTAILDRESSTATQQYASTFRLSSFSQTRNATTPNTNTLAGGGHVNGTLTIGSNPIDWVNTMISTETNGGNTNSVLWNTTSPYHDNISLNIFTAPYSNITYLKYIARIGTYSGWSGNGYNFNEGFWKTNDASLIPIILIKNQSKVLNRITVLSTKYANETPRTLSELTVTGAGHAVQIISSDGNSTDTIYTGQGNSTFNGFTTDADTVFIRKNSTSVEYAMIVNGSSLTSGAISIISSGTKYATYEYSDQPEPTPTTPPTTEPTTVPTTSTSITITPTPTPNLPTAAFSVNKNTVRVPGNVSFLDTSVNEVGGLWYFPDTGSYIASSNQILYHTFTKRGIFQINLTVENPTGQNTVSHVVRVIGGDSLGNIGNGDWQYDSNVQIAGILGAIAIIGVILWRKRS